MISKRKIEKQEKQEKAKKEPKMKKVKKKKKVEKKVKKVNKEGKRYVLTGVFRCCKDRKMIKRLLEDLGERVTGQVSKVTDFLVHGHILEDGREFNQSKKYRIAEKYSTKIISEEDLSEIIKQKTGKSLIEQICKGDQKDQEDQNNYYMSYQNKQPVKKGVVDIMDIVEDKGDDKQWTEIYKPTIPNQILGNKSLVKKLIKWLKEWRAKDKNNKQSQKEKSRAVLISGVPGIGKTTTATVICKFLGFDYTIQNSSDERNKKTIQKNLSVMTQNQKISFGEVKRSVLIMDEIDGMKGDRGGVKELVEQIKNTKIPVICICNDRDSQKIKTLSKYCLDLKFKPPSTNEIFQLLEIIITQQRGIDYYRHIDKAFLMELIEQQAQNDIRYLINYIQMWLSQKFTDNYNNKKQIFQLSKKDDLQYKTPYQCSLKILNTKLDDNTNYSKLVKLFFVDYNLMDFWIFANYLGRSKQTSLDQVSDCLDSMIIGDQIDQVIKSEQNYSLLPEFAYFSTIKPALLIPKFLQFLQFPLQLSKISQTNKTKRLNLEIRNNLLVQTGFNQQVPFYVNLISQQIQILMDSSEFQQLYDFFIKFNLNPEIIKENINPIVTKNFECNSLNDLSQKTKASFRKFYKKRTKQFKIQN